MHAFADFLVTLMEGQQADTTSVMFNRYATEGTRVRVHNVPTKRGSMLAAFETGSVCVVHGYKPEGRWVQWQRITSLIEGQQTLC